MPLPDFEACFFIREPPIFEYRDGLFHVSYNIGKQARFEIVMLPSVFAKARLLGAEACAKWQLNGVPASNVTNMRRK